LKKVIEKGGERVERQGLDLFGTSGATARIVEKGAGKSREVKIGLQEKGRRFQRNMFILESER